MPYVRVLLVGTIDPVAKGRKGIKGPQLGQAEPSIRIAKFLRKSQGRTESIVLAPKMTSAPLLYLYGIGIHERNKMLSKQGRKSFLHSHE